MTGAMDRKPEKAMASEADAVSAPNAPATTTHYGQIIVANRRGSISLRCSYVQQRRTGQKAQCRPSQVVADFIGQ